jgi:hypothetical protein
MSPPLQYVLAAHRVHGPPAGPLYPPSHMQSDRAELDAFELESTGHMMDEVPPAQYRPAVHAEHGPPLGPLLPGLHVHSVTAELNVGDVNNESVLEHKLIIPIVHHVPTAHAVQGPPPLPE